LIFYPPAHTLKNIALLVRSLCDSLSQFRMCKPFLANPDCWRNYFSKSMKFAKHFWLPIIPNTRVKKVYFLFESSRIISMRYFLIEFIRQKSAAFFLVLFWFCFINKSACLPFMYISLHLWFWYISRVLFFGFVPKITITVCVIYAHLSLYMIYISGIILNTLTSFFLLKMFAWAYLYIFCACVSVCAGVVISVVRVKNYRIPHIWLRKFLEL